ncbi:hypothetical protein PRIPAC_97513 [Pristionchus pacificus]|uniref:Uncharacterized protein n=1 Tax=Pristionchus pacificus TaxID=54126 RepID=A0A2A6BXU2_PRIPA|nr:hypothetical protein PRIPAC_97513 [Pristionchus pacificus]|eukprot:PDM70647.1 hypothetical protein PRIPAC_43852 [Pristionchus pacificus]
MSGSFSVVFVLANKTLKKIGKAKTFSFNFRASRSYLEYAVYISFSFTYRVNVCEACSRMEEIVGKTDPMARCVLQFYLFNGTPWSTPFGMQEQGIGVIQMEEFLTARARLTRHIALSEVILDKRKPTDQALATKSKTDGTIRVRPLLSNGRTMNFTQRSMPTLSSCLVISRFSSSIRHRDQRDLVLKNSRRFAHIRFSCPPPPIFNQPIFP